MNELEEPVVDDTPQDVEYWKNAFAMKTQLLYKARCEKIDYLIMYYRLRDSVEGLKCSFWRRLKFLFTGKIEIED